MRYLYRTDVILTYMLLPACIHLIVFYLFFLYPFPLEFTLYTSEYPIYTA